MGGDEGHRERHANDDGSSIGQPGDLRYEAQVRVLAKGGTVSASGDRISVKGADEAVVLIAAGTDYVLDYARSYKGAEPHAAVNKALNGASLVGSPTLRPHISRITSVSSVASR